jgi:hypothetical protein
MKKRFFVLILFFLGLIAPKANGASPLQWKKYRAVKYDTASVPSGKTVSRYFSPDRKYDLYYLKNGQQDNPFSLYLHNKNIYTFIDDFQEIKKVEWDSASTRVSFQGIKAINNTEISYWKAKYLPEKNILLAMILKIDK